MIEKKKLTMRAREILTVILVMAATLFFFLAPRFYIDKGVSETRLAELKMEPLRAAISNYIRDIDRLPGKLEDLIVCPEGFEDIWMGPYIKASYMYDPWKNKYVLEYGYRLQSYGADGIKGGDGKNADLETFTGLVK
jgi:general secretion pathway protein G